MESKEISDYEEAMLVLEGLCIDEDNLKEALAERCSRQHLNPVNCVRHLKALGVKPEDLDALNIIHVAGTKGKGSTCAFTESVLRKHGYKTGFYSSPHLVSKNERIRINGIPLPKEKFAAYFWEVYKKVQQNLVENETMPTMFSFLTVMALYVFIKEQVEAAIVEVGLGGLYDATNIFKKPIAVGITTLDIDHVTLLGDTIELIAEHKGGIMKPDVPAFTVPQQENAMEVLQKKAKEIGCPLLLSPPVEAFEEILSLGIPGKVQNVNASLALQLTNTWLKHQNKNRNHLQTLNGNYGNGLDTEESLNFPLQTSPTFKISNETKEALESCYWQGRCQTVEKGKITYYLDGAHTKISMQHCAKWFAEVSSQHSSKYQKPVLKVLLFNFKGERKPDTLLVPLSDVHFDLVVFSSSTINVMKDDSQDLSKWMAKLEKAEQDRITNKDVWCHLTRKMCENGTSPSSVSSSSPQSNVTSSSAVENILLFPLLSEVISFFTQSEQNPSIVSQSFNDLIANANHIQVLVTGSLRLVGGVLSLLES